MNAELFEELLDDLYQQSISGGIPVNSILWEFEKKTGTQFDDEESINDMLEEFSSKLINLLRASLRA